MSACIRLDLRLEPTIRTPPRHSFESFPSMRFVKKRMLGLMAAIALGVMACFGCGRSVESTNPTDKPRLAVLVVFDQMRGDYLTRWETLFADNGFRRLMKN